MNSRKMTKRSTIDTAHSPPGLMFQRGQNGVKVVKIKNFHKKMLILSA